MTVIAEMARDDRDEGNKRPGMTVIVVEGKSPFEQQPQQLNARSMRSLATLK